MSDAKDQHEPSMEEILASIRRIISEDETPEPGEAPPAAAAAPAAAPAPSPAARASAAPSPAAPAPAAAPAPSPRPALIADAEDDDDILVLTEEVKGDQVAPAPEEMPLALEFDEEEPPPEPESPLSLEPEISSEPEREADPEPLVAREHAAPPQPAADLPFDDRLLSDHAAAASLAALSELITRSHREPEIESLHMGNSDRTLEELTRELLRPILRLARAARLLMRRGRPPETRR